MTGGLAQQFPVDGETSWRDDAACRGEDPDLFFPESDASARFEVAMGICGRCPVIEDCLEFAIATRQDQGIWGGTSEDDRLRLIRRRQRQARASTRSAS